MTWLIVSSAIVSLTILLSLMAYALKALDSSRYPERYPKGYDC